MSVLIIFYLGPYARPFRAHAHLERDDDDDGQYNQSASKSITWTTEALHGRQ